MRYLNFDVVEGKGTFLTITRRRWWWPFSEIEECWFYTGMLLSGGDFTRFSEWVRSDGKRASQGFSVRLDGLLSFAKAESSQLEQLLTNDEPSNVIPLKYHKTVY